MKRRILALLLTLLLFVPAISHSVYGETNDCAEEHAAPTARLSTASDCVNGHDYQFSYVVAPTCVEGRTVYQCSNCGNITYDDFTEPVTDHNYQFDQVIAPTCTEGYTVYLCTVCGQDDHRDYTAPIDEHDYQVLEVIAPTCAEGCTVYRCSVCGQDDWRDFTAPIAEHDYQVLEVVEPTCMEGYTVYRCSVCALEDWRDYKDPVGEHSYQIFEVIEPTCVEGYTIYSCTVCHNWKFEDITAPVSDHDCLTEVTPPSCQPGYTTYTCKRCDYIYKGDITAPVAEHNFRTAEVVAPTCFPGYTEYQCSSCDAVQITDYVPPIDEHDWDVQVIEPSCGPGYTVHDCSKCGYGYIDNIIDPIPGMQHDDSHPWYEFSAEPSCGMGYTFYRCSICHEYYKADFVDALLGWEHIYIYDGIAEPYCDIQGKSQFTCLVCDEEIITYTDPLGHSFGEWQTVREATDTDPGLQEHACDRCGKKETRVPPASEDTHEHEYISSIVEPTCETKGYRRYQCACGSITTDSPTPALGHKYGQWELNESTGISTRTCLTCGKTETKGDTSSDSEEKPSSSVSGLDSTPPPFTDVSKTDDSYEAICYVYQNNLFKGISDTEFAPDQTMTRAMFVTVAGRHAKIDTKLYEKKLVQFEDVSQNAWYSPYAAWATENNIVKGYSETVFGVDDPITVEQAAVILARYAAYAGYDTTTADNGKLNGTTVSDWAKDAMNWAIRNNICTEELAKKPQNHSTREMVAQMLYRFDLWSKSAPKK